LKKTIFVVDDNEINLAIVKAALSEEYNVVTMNSGKKLFEFLQRATPHLILLDIDMPIMDGFDILKKLKALRKYTHIPVIFLTGTQDAVIETNAFNNGIVDFVRKPFDAAALISRLNQHINTSQLIRERAIKFSRSNEALLYVLADIVESRDSFTGGHLERTAQYITILAHEMNKNGIYSADLTKWDVSKLAISALLHDIGKIAIPDSILNKPGKLTAEEYEIVKTHAIKGEVLIDKILSKFDDEDMLLYNAKMFALYHHERWDGNGYPYGLKHEEIPIQGRIMAIVDVYDALTTKRPYKHMFEHEEALKIILEGSGTQFDPLIVDSFYTMRNEIKVINENYRNSTY